MRRFRELLARLAGAGLSKTVALVAALAMLVSVVGAGTAVAEESDTTLTTQSGQTSQTTEQNDSTSQSGETQNTETTDGTGETGEADDTGATGGTDKTADEVPAPTSVDGDQSGQSESDQTPEDDEYQNETMDIGETRAVQSITPECWITNQHLEHYCSGSISAGTSEVNSTEGVLLSSLANSTISTGTASSEKTYTFWKASLKGTDGETEYGPKQTGGNNANETATGKTVTRVRYQDGTLQFMSDGDWFRIYDSSGLQLVFYYLQDKEVGTYVTFHMSDWYASSYNANNWNQNEATNTYKAVVVKVVDADSNDLLAHSDTMYYHLSHDGVSTITVSEKDLGDYEIVGISKHKAANQNHFKAWNSDETDTVGDPLAEYKVSDMTTGMSTSWNPGSVDDENGKYDPPPM
ncbi:hypothetical protein BEUL_0263 [Bifidobacterium eulemuris]|uniref:Uncharacterized protein n=1 Tax=Bifidobacterium eulemuris TaxID=1765219 RepID=A0A261GDK7_9BIFI|nr:hypothetical protein [Bifidobacterium eulemuris]OZG69522.1 hypothetical protein BEUL_0263 [Bifidobacterium eulemuris]